MNQLLHFIQQQTQLPENKIKNTVQLLDEDCTIPFIARYRKEQTGNLDEVQISDIVALKNAYEALEKRKTYILKALEEQEVLTTELQAKIQDASDLTTLEDIYLPFKKSRKTKAEKARKNGLEPLAKIIMAQRNNSLEDVAQKYVRGEVSSVEKALEGARHIIAEWINERPSVRNKVRKQLDRYAQIVTKVVKDKAEDEKAQKYRDYFEWEEPLKKCPSHRLLAILRAESEGIIKVKVEIDDERMLSQIADRVIKANNACADHIEMAIKDGYKRLLLPALTNERLKRAKEDADSTAITVFANNLQQLLLGAPLGEKRIMGIDPGFRTGCKVVCLDAQGDLEYHTAIYPHPPQKDEKDASHTVSTLVEQYGIEAIAIGNGTASRETERFVRAIKFSRDIPIFVVSEAGASIYSASKIAREEFPDCDVTVRGAVSIGRRLADPLAELVKIDPKAIGVGQYQHDVDQTKLKTALDRVVEHCVNAVGVNINTASAPLLSYVSGIGPKLADNIVEYRDQHGAFTSRETIKKVPRLGAKAFEQSAGFLRVKNGDHPLDNSAVHPESYPIVTRMAKDLKQDIASLIGNTAVLRGIEKSNYITDKVGLPTLEDIVKELEKPGLDTRQQAKAFSFDPTIATINDLHTGQILPGIVNNITNFGCFVDIGIKESGLIHISNLSDGFVSDVNAHVHLHQQIKVEVLDVDIPRKRIQLKMHAKM